MIGFLEGQTFTDDDLRDGGHLARVAAACRQLHAGPRFVYDFDMFEVQRSYLDIVQEHGFRLPDRYLEFADKVEQIQRAFAAKPTPTVPCNNDLLAGNFIDDGTKLWLIDYEYAGNNDACFELGNIWSEAGLTLEQLEELMEAYDGELLRHRVARARLWGLMSKYGWTLWGSIQHSVSAIDFDFWAWGDGEVRPGRRGVRRPRLRAPARAGEPGRLMEPWPASRRGHGSSSSAAA